MLPLCWVLTEPEFRVGLNIIQQINDAEISLLYFG